MFRIADRRHPMVDGVGAFLKGGRWNSPGRRVVYCAETYALAMLEMMVHAGAGAIPKTQVAVRIFVPEEVGIETVRAGELAGWDAEDLMASRGFGDRWLKEGRGAVLRVPSVVVQGRELNVLLNPEHPDFARIAVGAQEEVAWDARLFPGKG